MVGKLDFDVFHTKCFDFLVWMVELWYLRLNHDGKTWIRLGFEKSNE